MDQGKASKYERYLHFIPSRVEGLPDVVEVVVRPDRLELFSEGKWVVVRFVEIARWPRPAWFWRRLFRWGGQPRSLTVAHRDWFHPPSERFFTFFTDPQITIFLPDEDIETGYHESLFRRLQEVIGEGGFDTYDLG